MKVSLSALILMFLILQNLTPIQITQEPSLNFLQGQKVTNTYRRAAAYCAPKTYCYDPYNEPKGDEWKRSSTLPKRIGGYQIIT